MLSASPQSPYWITQGSNEKQTSLLVHNFISLLNTYFQPAKWCYGVGLVQLCFVHLNKKLWAIRHFISPALKQQSEAMFL